MTNSEVVMAVSLMLFFSFLIPAATRNLFSDFVVLILSHVSVCTPYVVLSVLPRLSQMDPNLYEAALDLGASPLQALFRVVIPFVLPGVISGSVMAFTLSMDDFIITQINKGNNGLHTLSTYIYEDVKKNGMEPFWFAVFSIIFVVVLTLLLIANNKKHNKTSEEKV
jgi:spermidine/putrescine transport system permease protein